jgi:thymidylate kinase
MAHVIIEGLDKTGKSTLGLELAKRLYMPVINRLKVRNNIFTEIMDFLDNTKQDYIIDRLHLSELAYGPVKRGKVRLSEEQLEEIESRLLDMGTYNIYCYGDTKDIEARFDSLKEDYLTKDDIAPVLHEFEKAIDASALTWHPYKIGDDYDEIAAKIILQMRRANEKQNEQYF